MKAATILIGGPRDGDLLAVERPNDPIRVPRAAETTRATYGITDRSPGAGFLPETFDVETYYPKMVSFFGTPVLVYLHESLAVARGEALDRALREHLLSDKAKAVIR